MSFRLRDRAIKGANRIVRRAARSLERLETSNGISTDITDSSFGGRSDYKATWNSLATTYEDAQMVVAGYTDEDRFDQMAVHTIEVMRRFIPIGPDDDVLEIGCGVGRVGRALSGQVRSWTGADISSKMVDYARHNLRDRDNVHFLELDGNGLDGVADESMDVVYCTVVFMHLLEWDRYRYVAEAWRVLRPGGRCFFDNTDVTSGHGWEVFSAGSAFPRAERPAHLSMVSSADELRTYAERAGFGEIDTHKWDDAWVGVTGVKSA